MRYNEWYDTSNNNGDALFNEMRKMGYNKAMLDIVRNKAVFVGDETIKEVCLNIYMDCLRSLTFYTGINMVGNAKIFISESDGSAQKYRRLIKPDKLKK